jgi:hypothetical protein
MWLLKSPLDQNPRVIYQKFNSNFKSHIIFGGQKEDKWMMCSITCGITQAQHVKKEEANAVVLYPGV